jgi:ankyrin repeat protein
MLSRSTETVVVLLDKGAVVSAQDLGGSTALHLAADQGHREIISLLIDRGAEVGLVDKRGRTPLHRSARLGYRAATKLLVDRGSVVTMVLLLELLINDLIAILQWTSTLYL